MDLCNGPSTLVTIMRWNSYRQSLSSVFYRPFRALHKIQSLLSAIIYEWWFNLHKKNLMASCQLILQCIEVKSWNVICWFPKELGQKCEVLKSESSLRFSVVFFLCGNLPCTTVRGKANIWHEDKRPRFREGGVWPSIFATLRQDLVFSCYHIWFMSEGNIECRVLRSFCLLCLYKKELYFSSPCTFWWKVLGKGLFLARQKTYIVPVKWSALMPDGRHDL